MQYKKLQGGRVHKIYPTPRQAMQLQFVKGLRARWFCLAVRIRSAGLRLPTSDADY